MLLEISLRARINLLEKSISLFTFCKGKSFILSFCSLAAVACALCSAAMSNSRAEQTPLQPKKKKIQQTMKKTKEAKEERTKNEPEMKICEHIKSVANTNWWVSQQKKKSVFCFFESRWRLERVRVLPFVIFSSTNQRLLLFVIFSSAS